MIHSFFGSFAVLNRISDVVVKYNYRSNDNNKLDSVGCVKSNVVETILNRILLAVVCSSDHG